MKRIAITLLGFVATAAHAQFNQCASTTFIMPDANFALGQFQQSCSTLRVLGTLSAARTLVLSSTPGTQYTIINATVGGYALNVGTGSGATVAVAAGTPVTVVTADGRNYTLVSGGVGGDSAPVQSVAGKVGAVVLGPADVGAVPADGATPIAVAQVPQLPASKVTGLLPVVGGTQALSGGVATVTVPSGTAACTATDSTAVAAVSVSLSGTTLTLTGTNSDVVSYLCLGSGSALTATTTTLSASSTTPTQGQSVTFTATVAPSAATGTVTFKDGSTTLGTGTLSSGAATYSTSALAAGTHSITATYGGNSTYAASTSSAVTVTVSAQQTAATPTASPAAGTYSSAQNVSLASTTPSNTIYYTTDGSTPTTSSAVYSGAIPVASSKTINAIATASGYTNSAVGSFAYTISGSSGAPYTDNLTGTGTLTSPWTLNAMGGTMPTKNNGTVTSAAGSGTIPFYNAIYNDPNRVRFVYANKGFPVLQARAADGRLYLWAVSDQVVFTLNTDNSFGKYIVGNGAGSGNCPAVTAGDTIDFSMTSGGVLTCKDVTTNTSGTGTDSTPLTGGFPGFYFNNTGQTLTGPITLGNN